MNRVWIRGLSMVLCVVMILGLAACGNSSGSSGGEQSNPSASGMTGTPDNSNAPDYVWKSEFHDIEIESTDGYVQPVLFTDNGFYATSQMLLGRREAVEGQTETYEGQFDVYSTMLYFVHRDGTVEKLPNFKPSEPRANTEDKKDFYSDCELGALVRTPEGKLAGLELQEAGWYDGPDELYGSEDENLEEDYYQSEQVYEIVIWDTDGTELSRAKVNVDTSESLLDISQVAADRNGNLIVTEGQKLLAVASDGSVAWSLSVDNRINSLTVLPDGTPAILGFGDSGMEICQIDTAAKKLGTTYPVPDEVWSVFPGDEKHEIFYTSGLYLYGFKLGEDKPERILEWMNCNISSDAVENNTLHIESDSSIIGVIYEVSGDSVRPQIFTLTRVPAGTVPEKKVLTIAQLDNYPNDHLTNLMVRFNRTHDNVRLEYVDYAQYNTDDDDSVGTTKFNTEVMAGKLPDLIPTGAIPYRQIAAKGLLEDLYPYLDGDPELSREDIFPNLLNALEVNGGLFQVVPGFTVETLSGAASIIGDKPGWTYDEFNAALAKMPEGCSPLEPNITRDEVLSALLYANLDSFVDWNTGTVSFDSESFRRLLEFVIQFPEQYEADDDGGFADNTQELIRQGKQMLTRTYLYGLDDILWNDLNFGGKATMIGWPTDSGVGHIMRLGSGLAMSTTCTDKEAAWEFLRTLLLEKEQKDLFEIPSNRHAFEKLLKEYMTPIYVKDGNGNYLLDENGERIQESRSSWADVNGEHNIYAMTQEQADEVLEVIETCTRMANYDTSIQDIVFEQIQAYYAGQKSLDEIVRLIQSKVSIYVNEQR